MVLYHPTFEVLENINSYINDISILYAVDNSDSPNSILIDSIRKLTKVQYVNLQGNKGIATALNTAASLAIQDHYELLLTMDQDSKAADGMIPLLLKTFRSIEGKKTGIVSPLQLDPTQPNQESVETGIQNPLVVMTSGNLLNLKAYQDVGPFLEELFIDSVDIEFCLRLNRKNYAVYLVPQAHLYHTVGKPTRVSIFGKKPLVTNHNPIRRYYITRNKMFVNRIYGKEFPDFCASETRELLISIIKIILFEDNKTAKLWYSWLGFLDFCSSRLGKFKRQVNR